MKTQIDEKLLIFRSGHWHYQRRVPVKYRHIDTRRLVRKSLGTTSLEVARLRRDAMMEADDAYWRVLALEASDNGGVSPTTKIVEEERYRAATSRALVYGFIYKPVHQIAQEESPERILERLDKAYQRKLKSMLYLAEPPSLPGPGRKFQRLSNCILMK